MKQLIFLKEAELSRMGPEELEKYEMNLKIYRDYKNTIDTAFDEGKSRGKLKGKSKLLSN